MKTQIILRGKAIEPIVEIDGNIIPCKVDKYGNRIYDVLTSSGVSKIKIYSMKHELTEKNWWLFALVFYIISFFGIFNPPYKKKNYTLQYEGFLKNYSPVLDLQFNPGNKGQKAINCLSGVFDENSTNVYNVDPLVGKRIRLYNILKLLSWIIIAVVITFVFIFRK